ncbi:MAG: phosphodiester glycosidase family protein [Cyanobacteria bacterium J06641_5]
MAGSGARSEAGFFSQRCGIAPFATPGFPGAKPSTGPSEETLAHRTADFLQTHQLQLAVNANFFFPFHENTPWDYAPKIGSPVNLVGLSIAHGEVVSLPQGNRPALCFLPEGKRAVIRDAGDCPAGTQQAIAGIARLLVDSKLTETALAKTPRALKAYPLNIVAIDPSETRLWFLLTDGKQPLYSEGTTIKEAALLLQDLGAEVALQLDGGGSTTLVVEDDGRPKILNAVIQAKIPGLERPVANNLGFFAKPIQP